MAAVGCFRRGHFRLLKQSGLDKDPTASVEGCHGFAGSPKLDNIRVGGLPLVQREAAERWTDLGGQHEAIQHHVTLVQEQLAARFLEVGRGACCGVL